MTATSIRDALAWEALDSRGRPTVACTVALEGGATGTAHVPSGASAGSHEAVERRDGDDRYAGRGVWQAVAAIADEIVPAVRGLDANDQRGVDKKLRAVDGTDNLSRLGGNAVLAVSIATALAAAAQSGQPLYRHVGGDSDASVLPMPMVNIISGGAHAGGAVDVQDFLVIPVGATSFAQAIEWSSRVRAATGSVLEEHGLNATLVADEGGFGPALPSNRTALEMLLAGIEKSGLRPGEDAAIAIDVAATQLYVDGAYRLAAEDRVLSAAELVAELASWCDAAPIVSIEDALAEDDWAGWADATAALTGIQLVGDDLFVTNAARLQRGIDSAVANSVLVKPNQVGTLSDAKDVVDLARTAGYSTVVSARSGDTEDSWLADLAVGWAAGQIKVGSLTRSERTAKWNRLLELEATTTLPYAGRTALPAQAR